MLTNSQIDKVGEKLREGVVDAECLKKLDEFRSLFSEAYAFVEDVLVNKLDYKITGRPAKSTVAIVEKLKRETIRLAQIQDIAGCRVILTDLASQDAVVHTLSILFPQVTLDDKRNSPTHGYRAVHVVVKHRGRPVEIQVRTTLQHVWAELSEKVSDAFGQSIKYGVGPEWACRFLLNLSEIVAELDKIKHQKMYLSAKKMTSPSREIIRENKALNRRQREYVRRMKDLFASMEAQAMESA